MSVIIIIATLFVVIFICYSWIAYDTWCEPLCCSCGTLIASSFYNQSIILTITGLCTYMQLLKSCDNAIAHTGISSSWYPSYLWTWSIV